MLSKKIYKELYFEMLRIRRTEEAVAGLKRQGLVMCPVHLCIGQEASAVGVCKNLKKEDFVFGTHRSHGHYLAKGGDLKRLIAEILGRKTGCSGGQSGSMHICDPSPDVNFMGATVMVGGNIALAVGAAKKFSLAGEDRIAVAFFGDAATEEGDFYESLNFAAMHQVPVLFVCENNFYSVRTSVTKRQALDNIFRRGEIFGIKGVRLNGNNVLEVYGKLKQLTGICRKEKRPFLIENRTYRMSGHVEHYADILTGRPREEYAEWEKKCPVATLGNFFRQNNILAEPEIKEMEEKIAAELSEAIKFAKESPYPSLKRETV